MEGGREMEWQPIETAPKEGYFLAIRGHSLPFVAYCGVHGFYIGLERVWPTHWMPLPEGRTRDETTKHYRPGRT